MQMQDHYKWEAERPDGTVISEGERLDGCVRFSLVPQVPGLPRHDLVGVELLRRFNRGFIRAMGGKMKEYLYCVVCKGFRLYVAASSGAVLVTPEDKEVYL